ncbi:MAG: hypothetical protein KBH12_00915 [Synergistaceae bacterium]|nr:hypothetical protein [Synergistaceae bacterium]MBP9625719.1 hypothetical protein [Synergistaceae bacterium]MBP9957038.1 hypothetical protein [Synergistaceae bacterium]
MKKYLSLFGLVFFLAIVLVSPVFAADEGQSTTFLSLERVEKILYGSIQEGGLLPRLSKAEKDLFGRELPGSLTERQQALLNYLEKPSQNQPPMLFKLGVSEWIVTQRVEPSQPMGLRLSSLEQLLEGSTQSGPLGARLERLISKLLPEGIVSHMATLPEGTILKARFMQNLTVRTVKKGDIVTLELNEDCVANGALVAAKGSRVFAEITNVKGPRSFGRSSEIGVGFKDLETLDGRLTPVYIGPKAKKAMEVDSATIGAAGASLAGAVLLGPIGLAGGFLVRGSDKQIPSGSLVYVETTASASVYGYPIPSSLKDRLTDATVPQGTAGTGTSGQTEVK